MRKLFLLLFTLCAMETFASQPSQVVAQVAAQKVGWIASMVSKGSEYIKRAVNFVRKDPINLKVAYAAAGAALTYVASSMYEKYTSANKAHSDDFQTALIQLVHATSYYDAVVHKFREGLAFFIPAYTSLRATQALRNRHFTWPIALTEGLGAGAGLLPLMPLVCSYPVDGLVHIVSHIPSPCIVNRFRKGRLQKEEAWQNLKSIIKHKKYTVETITQKISESHLQLEPEMVDAIKSYAFTSCKKEETEIWVSSVPQEIQAVIDQANNPAIFGNIPLPKGILLLGGPGTGKTRNAHYIGKEIGGYFQKYSATQFFTKWVGEGEKILRDAYGEARAEAERTGKTAVIFIDEVEQIVKKRDFSGQQQGYVQAGNSLLTELFVQIDESPKVITICASNMPEDKFDGAFKRRMDHIITLRVPTEDEAFRLLTHEAEKYPQQMAPWLQDEGQALRASARAATLCQLSRDGICKTVVDAVRGAVAREYPVRKQLAAAFPEHRVEFEELLRQDPDNDALRTEVQAEVQRMQQELSRPILVQPTDIIQALASIREKTGSFALPGAMMQHGQLAQLSGRPRRLSSASPMTVAWTGRAPIAVAAAAASAVPQLPDTYDDGI